MVARLAPCRTQIGRPGSQSSTPRRTNSSHTVSHEPCGSASRPLVLSRVVPHWHTDDVSAERHQAPVADGFLQGQHIEISAKIFPFARPKAPTQAAIILADVVRHRRSLRAIGVGECWKSHKFCSGLIEQRLRFEAPKGRHLLPLRCAPIGGCLTPSNFDRGAPAHHLNTASSVFCMKWPPLVHPN